LVLQVSSLVSAFSGSVLTRIFGSDASLFITIDPGFFRGSEIVFVGVSDWSCTQKCSDEEVMNSGFFGPKSHHYGQKFG
jgi:hypothetical protein